MLIKEFPQLTLKRRTILTLKLTWVNEHIKKRYIDMHNKIIQLNYNVPSMFLIECEDLKCLLYI